MNVLKESPALDLQKLGLIFENKVSLISKLAEKDSEIEPENSNIDDVKWH